MVQSVDSLLYKNRGQQNTGQFLYRRIGNDYAVGSIPSSVAEFVANLVYLRIA